MNIIDMTINDYLQILSSDKMPGGGSASALASSQGVSLLMMVINISYNNKKFIDYKDKYNEIKNELNTINTNLIKLIDEDVNAFNTMIYVYKLPKNTNEEIEFRSNKMQNAIDICIKPPIEIIKLSYNAISISNELINITSASVVSDIYCGIISLKSGIYMAYQNILINAKLMKDNIKKEKILYDIDSIINESNKMANNILNNIKK